MNRAKSGNNIHGLNKQRRKFNTNLTKLFRRNRIISMVNPLYSVAILVWFGKLERPAFIQINQPAFRYAVFRI